MRPLQLGAHELLPRAIGASPLEGERSYLPGRGEAVKLGQRGRQHLSLLGAVVWPAKRASHREVDEYRARRPRLDQDVPGRPDDQRRRPQRFDARRDETHGLVAERSIRHQQGQVSPQPSDLVGQRGRQVLLDLLVQLRAADE